MRDDDLRLLEAAVGAATAMFEASLLAAARLQRAIHGAVAVQVRAMEKLRHWSAAEAAAQFRVAVYDNGSDGFAFRREGADSALHHELRVPGPDLSDR